MFKKSRIKIVASIMAILALLWVTTLGVILIASYTEVSSTNLEMLEEYADMYILDNQGGMFAPGKPNPGKGGPHFGTNHFKVSIFYAVAVSYDGRVLAVSNDETEIYSDDELKEITLNILKGNDTHGIRQNLVRYSKKPSKNAVP